MATRQHLERNKESYIFKKLDGKQIIQNLALSVRQPFADQIMQGTKKIEYRNMLTRIRGTVYIYASKTPKLEAYEKMKVEPGTFPVGVLVGTVENR
ncbi:MAG: ASCH domain-containing protein [Anaerolineales bacterium]|uniref:ASCH domain-containing protein n=1 Tax=Candidatus Villigracilis proximus TaxID=3140683 RepID=UPI003135AE1D|nr:ASCH domain-containing protein [Anaerolineales bacterium]